MSVLYLFLTFFSTVSLAGCSDFLSVREAEEPAGSQTLNTARTPAELLGYFQTSLKNSNSAQYLALLADSVVTGREFTFSSLASDVSAADFTGWGRSQEKQFIQRLFATGYIPAMTVTTEPFSEPQQDTLEVKFTYQFKVITPQDTTGVLGKSAFLLVKKNSYWYLARWRDEDYPLNGNSSFSRLKLTQ